MRKQQGNKPSREKTNREVYSPEANQQGNILARSKLTGRISLLYYGCYHGNYGTCTR